MQLLGSTFARIALALGVSVPALFSIPAAAQSIAPSSSPIIPGSPAEPPQGYLDFCARHSDQCQLSRLSSAAKSSAPEVAAISSSDDIIYPASTLAGGSKQQFDWLRVFASAETGSPKTAQTKSVAAGDLVASSFPAMTEELWGQLETVNRIVNVTVRSVSDVAHYGSEDFWELPFQGGQNAGDCEDYVLQKRQMLLAHGIPMAALSIALVKTSWGEPHAVLLVRSSRGDYVLDNLTPWIKPWTEVSYSWIKWQSGQNPELWLRPSVR